MYFFNLGSLTIGLAAWLIAFLGIYADRKKSICQLSSFSCCCTALLLQFFEIKRRMAADDWTAVDDTINAVSFAAAILVLVTVVLNFLCEKRKKGES